MKLRNLALCIPLATLLVSVSCFRHDVRTIVIDVPQMKSPECSKIIQDAMSKVEGIEEVTPDVNAHKLSVRYNALKLAIKNIEFVIASAGFDANTTMAPPETRAALPAGCR